MPGKGRTKKGAARAKGETTGKVAANTAEFDYFDKVYNKKGKVCIFPDILVPKPKLYKTVTTRKDPLQASRRQGSASQDAENHADKTTGEVSESQQQAQGKGERSTETSETPSSVDAANGRVPKSSQEENVKNLANSEDGQKGERQGKKPKIKEPKSYVLDEEKLKDKNVQEQLRAEECKCLVMQQIKAALEEAMGPDDPPVFILHNQNLTVMVDGKQRTKIELNVLTLHPTLGVLLVEVKAVKSRTSFSRFDVGTEQLLRAEEFVLEEIGDLLEEDAIVLTMALPELQPKDSSFIRKKAQELSPSKQENQDAAATPASVDKSGGERGAEQGNEPKFKGTALLGDHPEVFLLCGSRAEVFTVWVGWLRQQCPKSGHAFKGANGAERLDNFKRACMRRLSFPSLRPGQSVKDSADLHRRFLLTEEQLRVRDSQANFLHISGPPGSGKTLLLAERARRWLREGRHVALAVGSPILDLLLRQLAGTVCGVKADIVMISAHKGYADLLIWLNVRSIDDPVYVIVDEASAYSFDLYDKLLDHVRPGHVCGLWSADTRPLPDRQEKSLHRLGGTTPRLSQCLRSPPHVMAWINSVKLEEEPPLLPPLVPVTRELGVGVKVISHPDHPHSQSWKTCPTCGRDTRAFFASLGLQENPTKFAVRLSDVVVITTGEMCNKDRVAGWLQGLGLHAVAEKIWGKATPVLSPTPESPEWAEEEAQRSRVLKGVDAEGKPAWWST